MNDDVSSVFINQEKLGKILTESEKETLKEALEKTEEWLKKEADYDKEDFEGETKDLEK